MKHINIFFTCDNNYLPFLDVTLYSIEKNASKNYCYDIHILNTGVSEEYKQIIKKHETDSFIINFTDIRDKISDVESKLHTRDYYTSTTYFRLFIPNMYKNIDKCIYIDCDIIVKGDISELYNYDIGDNLIGGVPDEIVSNVDEFKIYTLGRLGVPFDKYVNAGVLVMNLKKMREFDFQTKFLDMLNKVKFTVAQDQDYINYICKDRKAFLPKIWNKQPIPDENTKVEDIRLLHFNLNLKPWHYDNIFYQEYFWEYAKLSPFYENILERKKNYSQEKKDKDFNDGENLKKLALYEAEHIGEVK